MTTYAFKNRGHGMPYQAPGDAPFKMNINIPDLIANGGMEVSGVEQAIPSTGFTAADIIQVFEVPAGFMVTMVGARVTTAEGATCTADIGNTSATQTHRLASNPDGMMGTFDLNSETTQITLIADEDVGGSTYMGVVFITDGTIDLVFGHSTVNLAVFDIWAVGWKVF